MQIYCFFQNLCLLLLFSRANTFISILLYVVVPGPPAKLRVSSMTSRVVNIIWTPGFNGNSDILNYTIQISTDNQTFSNATCQGLSSSGCVVSSSFASASLVGLHPGRTYYIRMFATNIVGSSAVSSVVMTTTDEEGTCACNTKFLHNFRFAEKLDQEKISCQVLLIGK